MNTESCERPTWKLSVAFAGMCWLIVDGTCRRLFQHDMGWAWVLFDLSAMGFGIWLSWFGIFRTAGMQLLWGWMCLLVGILILGTLAAHFLGWVPLQMPLNRMPVVFFMPVTGWLLIVDRDVARYRTHLRKLDDARCKLRLGD